MDKGRNSFQILQSPETDNYGNQLQNVINNLPCAFAIFNVIRSNNEITDFICSYINKTGLSELGLSEEATLNKKLKELFSQNSEVLFRECIRVINDNVPYRFDLPFNIINKNKRKTEKTFDISIAKLNESVTLSWVNIDRNGKQLKRNKNEVKLLPDSEEIFIKTFYASPDAIIVSRLNDGKILEINSSAEALFGYTKNEIISKTSAELGLFADHSNRDIALSLLKENESVRDFSIDVVRKSGEVRQASLSIEFLNVEGERCILKSIRDITERKQIEQALLESEKKYRNTLDNLLEGCAIIGFDWTYIYVNPVNAIHAHLRPEDMIGRNMLDIIPGVENSVFFTAYKRCMEERTTQQVEAGFTFENGSKAWYQAIAQPVPEGIFVLSADITERKRAEEELRNSQEILSLILDHVNEGIIVSEAPDGKAVAISRWGANYTVGRSVDAIIDLPVESYLEQWDVRDINTREKILPERLPVYRALRGEVIQGEEILIVQRDGTDFIILANAVPIYNEDKTRIVNVISTWTDITERKKAEEASLARMTELETILDSIADGVIIYDNTGKIVRLNAAADEILKYPQVDHETAMLERVKDRYGVWSEDGRKLKPEEMPAMRASVYGETVKGILVRVQGAGEPRWVIASAAPLFVSGKQIGAVASLTDISERKKAEEAMQKSEHRFRTLVTASSEVLYRMNPDWSEMTQLTGRGFLANTENPNPNWLQEYIHPDDQQQVLSVIKKAIRNKSTFELEHRVRQLNGGWGWTYSRAVPLMDTDGKIIEWFGAAADFTKRKQAEEAIKKAKEQYDLLFYSISEGFAHYQAIYDKNGRLHDLLVLEINPAGAEFSGVKREDQIGKTWKQVWTGIEDHLFDIYREVDRKGEAYIFEHFSGITKRWYTNRIYKIAQNQFAVTFFDITELKKTEEELRISKELYQSVVETQHDLIVKVDIAGRFTFVNEAYCRKFGYKREDLIGSKTFKPLVYEEDLPNTLEKLKELEHPPFRAVMEQRAYTVEGLRWIEWEDSAIKNDKGEIIEIQGVGRDIHERKIAEEALKESETKLLDAQKLAHMGNYTLDIRNNSIEWSEELYNIWELDKNKPIPPFEELWNMVHPDDRQKVKLVLEKEILTNEKVETELRLLFPGNRVKYIQLITRGFFDEAGSLIKRQGVEVDITERKEAMLNLERALKELELSNRDIEQYAFVTSHDLREPIRMVYSYSQLLEKKFKSQFGQNADIYLGFIREGAERLNMLVQDLFNYTQIGIAERNFVTVDVNNILQSVIYDMNNKIIESNAVIKYSELPEITADPSQIKQLFYQIIDNAIKFKSKDEPVIEIKCIVNEKEWLISIKDNGIGFKQEYSELIFSVFQRLNSREEYTGNGVGLAICKRIIGHHNGKIWAESEPGNGSTFYFTIPKN